jgi:uncharacterized membrane protein
MTANQPSILPSSAALARSRSFAGLLQTKLPWLFLIYAVPAVVFLAVAMPPFQVADELAHTLRADQIARGRIVSHRIGGKVHNDLVVFGKMYQSMWFHPEVKQTVELARQAGAIKWSSRMKRANFQNTAQYGPVLYFPQVVGIRLGNLAELSFAQTLLVERLLNGLSACAFGFLALLNCRRGRALMFATLLLPMTLSEFGSASQDALMISLSFLAIAIASRILTEGRTARLGEFALFAAIVTATTLARPSQLALALLSPAFIAKHDPCWRGKVAVALPAAATVVAWFVLLRSLMPPVPSDWSVSGQFDYLLANPLALPTVMVQTFASQGWFLLGSLIGRLGWLDTPMPDWFVTVACLGLFLALIAPGNRGSALLPGFLGVLTLLALLTATCFALYLSWTPVTKPTIDGLQGRYLLPVLPLLGWTIPAYGPRLERALMPAWAFVLVFPIVSLATLPSVIMERYYGSWEVMAESVKVLILP